jgi:hypothetical protein
MTFADGLKPVVSNVGSVPRTSLNINLSLASQGRFGEAKSLLCDMLRGTSPEEYETTLFGGGLYDCISIQSFQSSSSSVGCEDSNNSEWKSLQVQHQLSYYLDTEVSQEAIVWEGEIYG